jgi:hypothetical protein|tara:strand:+ start:3481 stop:4131 length:651 start_codon:yes stop_codon:yes gene_type:complete
MNDTTSLADLPSDPSLGSGSGSGSGSGTGTSGGEQNVVIQTTEKSTIYNPQMESAPVQEAMNSNSIDEQKTMNEVVSGIQQASASGATGLPSRDIPTNTVHFSDEQVQPNYVPQKEQTDYIQDTDTEHEILARRMKSQNSRDSLEILYDEFQIPILIGILYFIFQLPVVRSKMLVLIPSLFNNDGNPNLTGYVLNSLFFGILYYVISKLMAHLQHI